MNPANPAYYIFNVNIHDAEALKPYLDNVEASYKAFGGKRIVMGGKCTTLEGEPPQGRMVILAFSSMEKAVAWHDSPAYQAILPVRLQAATTQTWLVEGVPPELQ
ncbi:DUF1330 domain-containing protein [Enterobacter sp.]|uniref:DUF1330 domain-containing protein n=1 Tax=Enterobacter sp. TaxID=42895 RepID=UPI002904F3C1|nr:DUF1330 domain-containing protein [Enterobacter sp.]MDU1920109.1 DUF1330 domain-containing protein [Enterobacter sp.]MDU2002050.1 DUF1330 domain-containing protein [Enterobacter hormaechei]MDU2013738.1 DUF1330 domain-containing protein [Enterobacter hormaechei]